MTFKELVASDPIMAFAVFINNYVYVEKCFVDKKFADCDLSIIHPADLGYFYVGESQFDDFCIDDIELRNWYLDKNDESMIFCFNNTTNDTPLTYLKVDLKNVNYCDWDFDNIKIVEPFEETIISYREIV